MSPLVAAPLPSNNNIKFVLPGGLSCLREGLTKNLTQSESQRDARDKLDRDIEAYTRSADSHCTMLKAKAEAEAAKKGEAEAELDTKDPLDFWFVQVSNNCFISILSCNDILDIFRKSPRTTRQTFLRLPRTFSPVLARVFPQSVSSQYRESCRTTASPLSSLRIWRTAS